jgi:hypothetical protein
MSLFRSSIPILAASSVVLVSGCGLQQPAFDREKWAQGRGVTEGENPRRGMVVDAERAGVRPGASRRFVRRLLGAPDGVGPHADNYELGWEQFAPDSAHLRISYNDQDVVTRVDEFHR